MKDWYSLYTSFRILLKCNSRFPAFNVIVNVCIKKRVCTKILIIRFGPVLSIASLFTFQTVLLRTL